MELSPQESAVLLYLKDMKEINEKDIVIDKLSNENIRGAISWLEKKGLVSTRVVNSEELEMS